MRRSLRFFALVLTVFCLGATTALAQSVPSTKPLPSSSSVAEDSDDQTSMTVDRDRSDQLTSRQDVVDAMMQDVAGDDSEKDFSTTPRTASFDFSTSSRPNMQAEESSNRRVYYIIGGVLIAGGLAAGILMLDAGDEGAAGIPPPPGRPQ